MNTKIQFLFLAMSHIVCAQSTSTLMGARAAGMGYASSTTTDEWSLFNNVGGIGKTNSANVGFAYENRSALTGANRMAAVVALPTKIGAIGLGVFKFGDDVYNEHLVSLAYGNTIGITSLGIKANYIQYHSQDFAMNRAVSFDLGGITQLTPQISVGAYITNLTQSKLINTNGQRLPTKLTVGLGFKPSDKIFIATEIQKDLDYQMTWKTGIEYAVYKKIFFRTGYNLNPNAAFFGLGAQKKKLKMDYAFEFNQLIGVAHQASAVYVFQSKKTQ